jgi:hypothetical protein
MWIVDFVSTKGSDFRAHVNIPYYPFRRRSTMIAYLKDIPDPLVITIHPKCTRSGESLWEYTLPTLPWPALLHCSAKRGSPLTLIEFDPAPEFLLVPALFA